MKLKSIFLCLAIIATLSSCNKDEDPKVTITSPTNNAVFTVNDVLELRATVTDDNGLESILISSNLGLNETITSFTSETSHNADFNITFDPNTTPDTYSLTITATDDEGNTGSDSVDIIVQ